MKRVSLSAVTAVPEKLFSVARLLVAVAALLLYGISGSLLAARSGGFLFGADAHLYGPIALGEVYDRIFRFHPVTVASAELWMLLHKPFSGWISAAAWHRILYAAAGAAGVWIAIGAFARIVPSRLALLGGVLYALTLSVWFFSSIEESKIVSATLVALYIALWLRVREQWTFGGACLLTLVLFVACLNEIVACFLFVIPALDEWQRRGFDISGLRWLIPHGLVFLLALLILETAIPERLAPGMDAEGKSHFSMLFYYLTRNDYSLAALWSFVLNWLLFSIAAPASLQFCKDCYVYFTPAVADYFGNPWRAAPVMLLAGLLAAMLIPRIRNGIPGRLRMFLVALAGYSLVRGAFFFVFNPVEVMLYTPSVILAHLLLFLAIFAATKIPAKVTILAVLALLLFIANGFFIIGV